MGLFTINFELGDKALEMLTRVSETSVIRFELGPETRSMIEGDEGGAGVGRIAQANAVGRGRRFSRRANSAIAMALPANPAVIGKPPNGAHEAARPGRTAGIFHRSYLARTST